VDKTYYIDIHASHHLPFKNKLSKRLNVENSLLHQLNKIEGHIKHYDNNAIELTQEMHDLSQTCYIGSTEKASPTLNDGPTNLPVLQKRKIKP
jgi:hypothetical protein